MSDDLAVFVISLRDSDRLRPLESRLRQQGLNWHRVEAVDARGWSQTQLSMVADPEAGRLLYGTALSPPQVGCYLSHREVYRWLLNGSARWAIVLEDDAYPLGDLVALSEGLDKWQIEPPTIVELFNEGRVNESTQHFELRPGLELQKLRTYPGFTVAYAINRSAAKLALAYQGRVASRADWPPWAVNVAFWRTRPNVFGHGAPGHSPESTMSDFMHVEDRHHKFLRWVGLLSGVTYVRVKEHYPDGPSQFFRHAVLPSALYWRTRVPTVFGLARTT